MKFLDKISSYVLVTHFKRSTFDKIVLLVSYFGVLMCAVGIVAVTLLLLDL